MWLRVPAAALLRRDKDWMTFTVEDNRAKLTRVAIDHNNGEFAEVKDGLVEGQRVYPLSGRHDCRWGICQDRAEASPS
ncbi:MAG: hypothetical protein ABW346_03355 [Terrimicrobium sp.]